MAYHKKNNHIIFFPFLKGVKDLLASSDAQIVSSEGEEVLRDKKKMKKVEDAIKDSKKDKALSKSIIVKF